MTRRTQQQFGQLFQSYITNIFLFSVAIFIYQKSLYYSNFLSAETQKALIWMVVIYIVFAIPLEMLLPPERRRIEGKGLIALRAVMRFTCDGWRHLRHYSFDRSNPPSVTQKEKTCILFLMVKFYFLPVMTGFVFNNWQNMMFHWNQFGDKVNVHDLLLGSTFPFILALFFLIDTSYFVFGYSVEYPAARNEVRSVEPTFFGWFIALICYPPFNNGVANNYLIWSAQGGAASFENSIFASYVLQITALFLVWIYLWATLALGPRCSNLTNRGIVSWGPYKYVRHPAYICKALGWFLTSIPFLLITDRLFLAIFSLAGWATVYFFRALTEERHLIADPDYQEYCKKVQWRFIPYIF